jgi:uncharacterized CHY-type Zn-finger protein
MNKEIMKSLGFEKEVNTFESGLCPFCGKKVLMSSFRDALSAREYQISGLCQQCQDDFSKEGE